MTINIGQNVIIIAWAPRHSRLDQFSLGELVDLMSIHRDKIEILWVLKCIKKSRRVACANTSENGNNAIQMSP